MKRKKLLFLPLAVLFATTVIGSCMVLSTSCSSERAEISTYIVSGDDTIYYVGDTHSLHGCSSCVFSVISSNNHKVLVNWNSDDDVDDYVTITGVQQNEQIDSGSDISVHFDKQALPQGALQNKSLVFTLSDGDITHIFEITLVGESITPIPYNLLNWSLASNSQTNLGLWKLNGLADGIGKTDLVGYDTLLIPSDVVSISDNAFGVDKKNKCEIPDIYNLLFTSDAFLSCYEIGSNAFKNCQLRNIQIPETITRIGMNAFGNIDSIGCGNSPWDSIKSNAHLWLGDAKGNGQTSDYYSIVDTIDSSNNELIGQTIYPKGGLVDITYNSLANSVQGLSWGMVDIKVGTNQALASSVIPHNAYLNCESMSGFNCLDSITKIGDNAFAKSGGWEGTSTNPLPPYSATLSFTNLSTYPWNASVIAGLNWGEIGGTPCSPIIHVTNVTTQAQFNNWYTNNADPGYGPPPTPPTAYDPVNVVWPQGYYPLLPLVYDNYSHA